MSLNKRIGMGRLTADPETRQTQTGMQVVKFTVAIDRMPDRNGEKKADCISCTAFNKTAEIVSRYFSKGKMIAVEGNLQNNNYTDQNGVKHYGMQILVNSVNFCGDRQQATQQTPQQTYNQPQQNNPQQFVNNAQGAGVPSGIDDLAGFEEIISDGDVPF